MRHGKSETPRSDLRDHERGLTERGIRNAREQALLHRPKANHAMWISDAVRTRQTADAMLEVWEQQGWEIPNTIQVTHQGYLAPAETWIHLGSLSNDDITALWMIGHNPGVSDLVLMLTGQYVGMTTADIVHLSIRAERWSEWGSNCGEILSHRPGRGL